MMLRWSRRNVLLPRRRRVIEESAAKGGMQRTHRRHGAADALVTIHCLIGAAEFHLANESHDYTRFGDKLLALWRID